jgi:WD40 repeat protein
MAVTWDLSPSNKARGFAPFEVVAFSGDGTHSASWTSDRSGIRVEPTGLGSQAFFLTGHPVPVKTLCFAPDGLSLASGDQEGNILLWDLKTHQESIRWQEAKHAPAQLTFSPEGRWLAAVYSQPRALVVWGVSTMDEEGVAFPLGDLRPRTLAFSPDGRWLAVGGVEQTVLFPWGYGRDLREKQTLLGHLGGTLALAFSPDGSWLATGGKEAPVRLFRDRGRGMEEVRRLLGRVFASDGLAFSADGTRVAASGVKRGKLLIWDLATGQRFKRYSLIVLRRPVALAFLPDNKSLAYAGGVARGVAGGYLLGKPKKK